MKQVTNRIDPTAHGVSNSSSTKSGTTKRGLCLIGRSSLIGHSVPARQCQVQANRHSARWQCVWPKCVPLARTISSDQKNEHSSNALQTTSDVKTLHKRGKPRYRTYMAMPQGAEPGRAVLREDEAVPPGRDPPREAEGHLHRLPAPGVRLHQRPSHRRHGLVQKIPNRGHHEKLRFTRVRQSYEIGRPAIGK